MWFWVLDGAINLLGLALVAAGLSAKTPARINWLWRRATLCALGAIIGALALAAVSATRLAFALRRTYPDPSQAARLMTADISGAVDGFAGALLLVPLPLAALLVVWVRRGKLTPR